MAETKIPQQDAMFDDRPKPQGEMPPKRKARKKANSYELSNLGKAIRLRVPEFSDPDRPPVCLEVDFPIAPINALSNLEGNAGKPIYQMSKWWARRRWPSRRLRNCCAVWGTKVPTYLSVGF